MLRHKLTRYLSKTIFGAILLTLLLLVGLEIIFSFVNEMRFVGSGQYNTQHALMVILLSLPTQIAQLFPMAALVGCLLGLSILAARSELIVIRAAGLGITDIATVLLKVGCVVVLIAWIVGEVMAPKMDKMAHSYKAMALSSGQALSTQHGVWMRDKQDFVHIQSIENKKSLKGITRYQFDEHFKLHQSSFAESATYDNDHWVLSKVHHTIFLPDKMESSYMPETLWYSQIGPDILGIVGTQGIDELTVKELWRAMEYRSRNHLDARPYQLAFWQKLARPIATLVMILLALPFVFGPLRSATMGFRILVGVLVGFGFYTLSQLFGPLVLVYPIPPIVGAFFPVILFTIFGAFLMKRYQ